MRITKKPKNNIVGVDAYIDPLWADVGVCPYDGIDIFPDLGYNTAKYKSKEQESTPAEAVSESRLVRRGYDGSGGTWPGS